jgi:hypothetical protein
LTPPSCEQREVAQRLRAAAVALREALEELAQAALDRLDVGHVAARNLGFLLPLAVDHLGVVLVQDAALDLLAVLEHEQVGLLLGVGNGREQRAECERSEHVGPLFGARV